MSVPAFFIAKLPFMRFLLYVILFMTATVPAASQQFDQRQADSLRQVLSNTSNSRTRVETLIHLAEYHILKGGELQADLDSAGVCLAAAEQLNKTVGSTVLAGHHLLMKAYMLREGGNRKDGQAAAEQSLPLLQKTNSPRLLGLAYYELQGYYDYYDTAQCRKRILLTGLAVKAFHEAGEKVLAGTALTTQGDLHALLDEYAASNACLQQALAVYHEISHQKLQDAYELLGRNCYMQADYRCAFQYALLALKTAKATNDSSTQLATINYMLGALYRRAGRLELGIAHFKAGLAVSLRHKDAPNALRLALEVCRMHLQMNQPHQALGLLDSLPPGVADTSNAQVKVILGVVRLRCYFVDKQFNKAYHYAMILEKLLAQKALSAEFTHMCYLTLAKYYLETHAIVKARFYLNKNLNTPLPPVSSSIAGQRLEMDYRIDSAEGNYKGAFYSLRSYKQHADSLFGEVKARQFQQLDIEYETSKKADSISLLTQKNFLQTANLRQAHLIRNITIVGIVLALAVLGLLYRQYLVKLQNNRAMAVKNDRLEHLVNEKEWLLQEVNHRVKNNLQTVVSLLEMQSDSLSEDAQLALQTSQNRVYATSLLYQKLYRNDNVSSVNMRVYLTELVEHLEDALSSSTAVAIVVHVDPVELDVSQGVPVGLMVNELITNSFKYAFNETIERPEIVVSFSIVEDVAHLVVKDNGVGFAGPDESNFGHGLRLVKGLAENIGGKVTIVSNEGTSVQIRFSPKGPLVSDMQYMVAQ
jgi:two-component system, sensor histidine kinase PdtaS